jgi:hypothetical protein
MTCEIDKYARLDYAEQRKAIATSELESKYYEANKCGADWKLSHKGDL